eukprot:scaffold488_cov142-Skeletonema_menzelii.AAC.1
MAQSIKLSKIDKYYFLSMSNANNSSNGLHIISSSTWKVVFAVADPDDSLPRTGDIRRNST